MAYLNITRGGQPDFKGWFCEGQYAEYGPNYNAPHLPATPPFDSHADAAFGQGYLNLQFPLVPNLAGTYGHRWMQNALKEVRNVGDVIFTNWVPTRAFVDAYYWEVSHTDAALDGVYLKPVAYRVKWDFEHHAHVFERIGEFDEMLTAAGIEKFPLGTPVDGDKLYGICRDAAAPDKMPVSFGHNIPKFDPETHKPVEGYDEYFGSVLLGYEVVEGEPEKIELLWKSNVAVYFSTKMLAFEGSTQIG